LGTESSLSSQPQRSKGKHSRVLLIDTDGSSYYTCYLARGLSKFKDIILYSFSEEYYSITGADKEKGIEFHYIKKMLPKGYSALKGITRVLLLYFILLGALVRSNYDIVHVHENLPTFFLFIPLLKLRRKRICWTMHDVDIYRIASGITGKLQLLFLNFVSQPRIMMKYSDKILVHALSLREHLIIKGVDKNKICVIPHFDYKFLLEAQPKDTTGKYNNVGNGGNYVLFFGSIAPWKGIDTLIEAAKIVREKIGEKFNLVIAGTSYEGYREVPFFQNVLGQDLKYITIIDKFISSHEIPDLITNASFLVLPYHDSFRFSVSGVIPLAYTFAKPVVVSRVSSLTEYVEHNKTGLIFNTDNSKELADCIINLVENNIKCLQMGRNAYEKVATEMSLETCCALVDNIYNSLGT